MISKLSGTGTYSTFRRRTVAPLLLSLFGLTSPLRADAAPSSIVAGPGEMGLRAALASARDGDTIILTNWVELEATVRIDKRVTLRASNRPSQIWLGGRFEGELLQITQDGTVLDCLWLSGSPQTDALRVDGATTLKACTIYGVRSAVVQTYLGGQLDRPPLRLEEVYVSGAALGLDCVELEAVDSVFSGNGGYAAVSASNGRLDRCRFEYNLGNGLQLTYGVVRDCVFRSNVGLGLACDPDPGVLSVSGSLFYGNAGGGILLGEQLYANLDNCTFTRHTGPPAIFVNQASAVLLRHCTVADNLILMDPVDWPPPPSRTFQIQSGGSVELRNCLIANNPADDDPTASGLRADGWIDGGGNVIGGSVPLSALRNNGGSMFSLAPLPGSPAIDAGVTDELIVDGRGLSRLAGNAPDAGAVESGAGPLLDTDADGLPDLWELRHRLNPSDRADADLDQDGDGHSARAEFAARTDPENASSVLQVATVSSSFFGGLDQPGSTFVWPRVPGVAYRVETSVDLQQWKTARGFLWLQGDDSGSIRFEFTDTARTGAAFYRIVADGAQGYGALGTSTP